ncbi:HD-GYP domain-containing protein [Actinoallomurus soli]|uniref:HD-GYP domain-containing protein n=1 Tax=Actinoallomurus soli TaxID=2952535 RepID=UPI0020924B8D|nr:HD-GYP domain-containing protein [Actinoallomurus soli]MCO5972979.1 HD-GYP domain-containing protein [Actinoallomurus soli]
MRGLPLAARAYAGGVIALAIGVIATSSLTGLCWPRLAVLAGLFVVTESSAATLTIKRARVSMSFAAGLAAVVLAGPVGATLIGVTAILTGRRDLDLIKRLFNAAQYALSGYAAGAVFQTLGGHPYRWGDANWTGHVIGPFIGALVTFVTVNLALMTVVLLVSRQATWREVLATGRLVVPGCLGFGMIGLLIAGIWPAAGPLSAVLVLMPVFIARWAFTQIVAQQRAHAATVAALCQAVETKDYYTRGHSERVAYGSVMIAREIGMRVDRINRLRYAGMLHDVGKLGVPTKVLQKPGDLTEEEFAAIQLHPMRGEEIVRDIDFLDEALGGIMHHHERVDGKGYPMGLAGEEIPEFARIIAVADTFDAMTSSRSYRPGLPAETAIDALRRNAGTQFDPVLVDAFLTALHRDGWVEAEPVPPPESEDVETTQQDHDDPSMPIGVAGAQ